jgi:hypothetical protein
MIAMNNHLPHETTTIQKDDDTMNSSADSHVELEGWEDFIRSVNRIKRSESNSFILLNR